MFNWIFSKSDDLQNFRWRGCDASKETKATSSQRSARWSSYQGEWLGNFVLIIFFGGLSDLATCIFQTFKLCLNDVSFQLKQWILAYSILENLIFVKTEMTNNLFRFRFNKWPMNFTFNSRCEESILILSPIRKYELKTLKCWKIKFGFKLF